MLTTIRRYFLSHELYEPVPKLTLIEHKRAAWGNTDPAYRITQPGPEPKQHRRIQRWTKPTSPSAS